ncbi:hypothetical protein [Idiomarina xiamenensis]|uniref:Lipoprotein n=1 Tax=Idiomarina xiamenensis 10-D-4 TaxID=740709 RepID=K2JJ44_9GAMM|nr:hypothetical protein [Idiomarina xiamenensis]EKE83446.1 hypothetical protein A10D4_08492 [Idiomarina xiamenensis 10-D-4]
MKNLVRITALATVFSTLLLSACSDNESDASAASDNVIVGEWQIVDFTQPGISAMSAETAKQWIGEKLVYSSDIAQFRDQRCRSPKYHQGEIDARTFLQDFRVDPSVFRLSTPVKEVIVQCDDFAAGSHLLVVDEDTLITPWDGVFFFLKRHSTTL